MLPYKNRLIKRKDFESVYRRGSSFYSGNIGLKVRENGVGESRIGFSVGIRFSPKAVERNKAKRRLRDIFQKYLGKIEKNADIVVVVKKNKNEDTSWKSLQSDIRKALEKANLINKSKK